MAHSRLLPKGHAVQNDKKKKKSNDLAAFQSLLTFWDALGVKYLVVFFSIPVWHQRRKSRKPTLTGQIVLVKEDKELAQLRGMAETVGLANACYAVRYVLGGNAFSGQKHRRGLLWIGFYQHSHPWQPDVMMGAASAQRAGLLWNMPCQASSLVYSLAWISSIPHWVLTLATNTSEGRGKETWCFPRDSKTFRFHPNSP